MARSFIAASLPAPGRHQVTRYDELVIPYTSGLMDPGPNVANHTVQDYCVFDLSSCSGFSEHRASRRRLPWTATPTAGPTTQT